MPRARRRKSSWQRRIERGLKRGLTRSQAAGKPRPGEAYASGRPSIPALDPRLETALRKIRTVFAEGECGGGVQHEVLESARSAPEGLEPTKGNGPSREARRAAIFSWAQRDLKVRRKGAKRSQKTRVGANRPRSKRPLATFRRCLYPSILTARCGLRYTRPLRDDVFASPVPSGFLRVLVCTENGASTIDQPVTVVEPSIGTA